MVLYSGHSGQSAPRSAWTTESNSSNMANNESGAWTETIWVEMKGCGAAPGHHLDAVDAIGRSVLLSDFYLVFCGPIVCPSSGPRSLPATISLWRLPENCPQVVKHEGLSLDGSCGPGGAGSPGPLGRVRGGGPGPGRPGWGDSARGLCADGHDDGSHHPGGRVARDARDRLC